MIWVQANISYQTAVNKTKRPGWVRLIVKSQKYTTRQVLSSLFKEIKRTHPLFHSLMSAMTNALSNGPFSYITFYTDI